MKKVINGKLYDTCTAKKIAEWSNYGSWRDFSHCEEELYLKKTGEYFLHGAGGPMTKYSVREDSNSYTGGEKIIPMTTKEAMAWVENNCNADKYIEIFGEVAE